MKIYKHDLIRAQLDEYFKPVRDTFIHPACNEKYSHAFIRKGLTLIAYLNRETVDLLNQLDTRTCMMHVMKQTHDFTGQLFHFNDYKDKVSVAEYIKIYSIQLIIPDGFDSTLDETIIERVTSLSSVNENMALFSEFLFISIMQYYSRIYNDTDTLTSKGRRIVKTLFDCFNNSGTLTKEMKQRYLELSLSK